MTAPCWAQVSLMGHTKLYGLVTEEERYGVKGCRIDVPEVDGRGPEVHWHPPGALFGVVEATEEYVRQQLADPWVALRPAIRAEAYAEDIEALEVTIS